MKNITISALIAAVIFFFYQSLSWMILPVHNDSIKSTPNQDKILETINKNIDEEGFYSIPFWNSEEVDGISQEDFNKAMNGKPYATIVYKKAYSNDMGKSMGLGYLFNFLGLFFVSVVLFNLKSGINFGKRWLFVMAIALILLFMRLLTGWVWWQTPMHFLKGEIIDLFLGWALTGIWLAWFSNKKSNI